MSKRNVKNFYTKNRCTVQFGPSRSPSRVTLAPWHAIILNLLPCIAWRAQLLIFIILSANELRVRCGGVDRYSINVDRMDMRTHHTWASRSPDRSTTLSLRVIQIPPTYSTGTVRTALVPPMVPPKCNRAHEADVGSPRRRCWPTSTAGAGTHAGTLHHTVKLGLIVGAQGQLELDAPLGANTRVDERRREQPAICGGAACQSPGARDADVVVVKVEVAKARVVAQRACDSYDRSDREAVPGSSVG